MQDDSNLMNQSDFSNTDFSNKIVHAANPDPAETQVFASNEINPYQVSDGLTHPLAIAPPKPQANFFWLIPIAAGAALGSVLLAPFIHCSCDPEGHSLGAGAGGALGLMIGVPLRIRAAWKI